MRESIREKLDARRDKLNGVLSRAGMRFRLGKIWRHDEKSGGAKGIYPPEVTDVSITLEVINALRLIVLNTLCKDGSAGRQVVMDNLYPGITLLLVVDGKYFVTLDEYRIIYDRLMTEVVRGWLRHESEDMADAINDVLKRHFDTTASIEITDIVPLTGRMLIENSSISNAQTKPFVVFAKSKTSDWEQALTSDLPQTKARIMDITQMHARYEKVFPQQEVSSQVEFEPPAYLSGVYDVVTWLLFIQFCYVPYLRRNPEFIDEEVKKVLKYYQEQLQL
jgi:hypothetical protein